MFRPLAVVAVASCLWNPAELVAQAGNVLVTANLEPSLNAPLRFDTLYVFGSPAREGGRSLFDGIASVSSDRRGRLYVADLERQDVRVFTQSGRLIARLDPGPGDRAFRFPSNVAVAPDGTVFVFDQGRQRVTQFSSRLALVRGMPLPIQLQAVSFVATDDRLYFSGIAATETPNAYAIHVFDRTSGAYQFSFGELAPAEGGTRSPSLAGRITIGRGGTLWYAHPVPYRIEHYSPAGALLLRIERPNGFLSAVDSSVRRVVEGDRISYLHVPQARALGAFELRDGSLLHQVRLANGLIVTDLYTQQDSSLRLEASWVGATPALTGEVSDSVFVARIGGPRPPLPVALVRMRLLAR